MLVNNKRPRNHDIGLRFKHPATGEFTEALISLRPGVNEVDDDEWAEARKNKVVLGHLEAGDLVEVKGKVASSGTSSAPGATGGADAPPVEPVSLSEMTVHDASELIDETFDVALLRRWKSEDERVGVNKAIEGQLERLKLQAKEQKDAEVDDDRT